ncbi:hypothetical protein F4859DRAFT_472790 [Xylaria cf. heliscus]|nr:hypothetical protein F4859DRAFT_472790 [Xylaria cf. heliscus]
MGLVITPVMSQASNDPVRLPPSPIPWSREDNWQGISNARERRRIQNRINQRARRSRRRNETRVSTDGSSHTDVVLTDSCLELRPFQTALSRPLDFGSVVNAIHVRDPESWEKHSVVRAFEAFIYNHWLAQAPRPTLLPSLLRFNFARAIMANAKFLGITSSQLNDDAISAFNMEGPRPPTINLEVGKLPTELQPTDLQRRTVHHPWLDLLPIPHMRDNLLRRGVESFDEDEFCCALIGSGDLANTAFVVWSESWDGYGWEVTESFARSSWAWTIDGCWELYRSTNKWRAQRGEPPLFSSVAPYDSDNP